MGMYCCCGWKMSESTYVDCINKTITTYEVDPDGCTCDWEGWTSCCDYPEERKNRHVPISDPPCDGVYLVRRQNGSADRYEEEATFFSKALTVACGYTGAPHDINWSGDEDHQPYAWKPIV